MSKKTITKLLNCAVRDKAGQLAITSRPDRFFLDYLQPDGQRKSLSWKRHQEIDFSSSWRRIFDIAPGELVVKKYCRISNGRQNFNFYLTIRPESNGEKFIIDIAKPSVRIWRLSQLGLQTEDRRELEKIVKLRSGLVIVSSPPENGKSATLQALLLSLNDPSRNICLLDDQPSYEVPGVSTMRLSPSNWEKMRRHDAEIILAENLENGDNLKEAVLTATTGRLVIGTLQAEDAPAALLRLLEVDLPTALKIDSLKAIIGERLFPLKRPVRSGRKDGRQVIGLFEILKLNSELKKQLTDKGRDGRMEEADWRRIIAQSGFHSWKDDQKKKLKAGLI